MSRPSLVLLKDKKDLIGVEIGVQAGINAEWMLENLDIQKLYLVDPYGKYQCNNNKPLNAGGLHPASPGAKKDCKLRLKKWKDKIQYVYKYSFDAINYFEKQSIDFIYIDGDHRKETLLQDLEYITKIKFEGMLCGHDWRFPSVKSAIAEFITKNLISFECCGIAQFITATDKHVDGSDWWMYLPNVDEKFTQKCSRCQKMHIRTVSDIPWLK